MAKCAHRYEAYLEFVVNGSSEISQLIHTLLHTCHVRPLALVGCNFVLGKIGVHGNMNTYETACEPHEK